MPIIGQISVGDGATFTPAVDNDGVISWSNNKNLPNPASVDIPQTVMDRYQIAPIASPAFTGNPTAPTPAPDDDSTKIATTEYVQAELADYLPLSGGTMTGTLVSTQAISFRQNGENASLQLYGGTDSTSSRLILFGKANSTYPGAFSLEARDDSNAMSLYGAPSGTLIWGGNDIITAAGGTMTGTLTLKSPAVIANQTVTSRRNVTDSWNLLLGGTSDSNGAYLRLDGSTSSMTGSFTLKANDGTNSKTLVGSPDGTLTWGGKNVERVNASGTNYVRFDSGLQICWGTTASKTTNAGTSTTTTITFPVAFKDTTYTVTFVDRFGANNWQNHTFSTSSYTTTGVGLYLQNNAAGAYTYTLSWMAIGKWK